MADVGNSQTRQHMLSPSAWNRYETCPRMYWLVGKNYQEKQGWLHHLKPCTCIDRRFALTDYSHIGNDQDNWLPREGERLLKERWEEEKEIFMNTPRRPM